MSKASDARAVPESRNNRSVGQRYLDFNARSRPAFTQYPQVEPLRRLIFKQLLVQRRADGWTDHVKHWLRPFLRRARTSRVARCVDVVVWLETEREVIVEALLPVYGELVARGVRVELLSDGGPASLPVPSRPFDFPARARAPGWARGAWQALCECEPALHDRALERSFYHVCATLQALYDELHRVLEATAPRVVLTATTQAIGGAALMVAARQQGIGSLLLQHGMVGPNYPPLLADAMLIWGPSSEEILVSLGIPAARLLTVGSPRHDSMRPSNNGRARATLVQALGLSARPTFVFFSQGNDFGDPAVECARWLEDAAAEYGNALNFVVRLHANEDGRLYRHCPHVRVTDGAVALATVLEGCDSIGAIDSTALYDGLLYGKPVWQFDAPHWPSFAVNWRQGLASRVCSARHLSDMVGAMLLQQAADRVDPATVARVFASHGHATQAVAEVVTSRLRV
jgi:hypothetical protein